jgi:lysophospholipase L1-like esterase
MQRTHAWRTLAAVWAIALASTAVAVAEDVVVPLPGTAACVSATSFTPLTMRIEDVKGSYTIPFIQSSRELHVRITCSDAAVASADVRLTLDGKLVARQKVHREEPSVVFHKLAPGEYCLEYRGLDRNGKNRYHVVYSRLGIGTVIAALGDSITEGYLGRGYMMPDLNLRADRFPAKSVSRDGRNFPQFAPTAWRHLPSVNCFESWMTSLNNRLTDTWRTPVFITNEGWGGITTGGYLAMMRDDAGWKTRIKRLMPQVWLIHLGVNDERAHVKPSDVHANLAAMIDLLIKDYGAKPARIYLALPSYDYAPGAATILQSYAREIEALVKHRGLSRGPDFYAAFAQEKPRWYGADPVHPNVEGMVRMATLWHDALMQQVP